MFIMYFGDADGEQVQFRPLPIYRKGLLSVLVVVVLAMGIGPCCSESNRGCNKS